MATPYEKVYQSFFSNITDYNLLELPEASLKENLNLWLKQGIAMATYSTERVNKLDDILEEFEETLNNNEIQMIAKLMVVVYINTYLFKEDILAQSLNSKDYRAYSPANQNKALRELKEHINTEATVLMSRSSYSVDNLNAIRKRLKGDK